MKTKKRPEKKIIISKYNSRWPKIYEREKRKIIGVLGNKFKAIEHIGSTSVIGLAAKPVIDIMMAIDGFTLTEKLIKRLKKIGYEYVPKYEENIPDRRFFHRGPSEKTTGLPNRHFHLHVVEEDSVFWHDHVLFRNYIRIHQDAARKYENLKKQLLIKCAGNVDDYCSSKGSFIKGILRLAKKEQKKKAVSVINKFKAKDAKEVSRLILTVFHKHNSPGLSQKGKQAFCINNTPDKILAMSKNADIYIAKVGKKIVGVVSGVNNRRLINRLFVDDKFQGQGIAKQLLQKIESLFKKRGARSIHLRSSLYAINFYTAMGYKKVTRLIHNKDGMVYQPMIKKSNFV